MSDIKGFPNTLNVVILDFDVSYGHTYYLEALVQQLMPVIVGAVTAAVTGAMR